MTDPQVNIEVFDDPRPHPLVDREALAGPLEAVLMVVDEPVSVAALADAVEAPHVLVESTLRGLADDYREQGRGFDLREVDGRWRFYSRPEHASVVERFVLDGRRARLSQAALETLAVVAYRQPVTRAQVAAVRGVSVDGVLRTLQARGLVADQGRDPSTGAVRYGTTTTFLTQMGLASLDDLPALAPHLPDIDMLDQIAEQGLPT